MPVRFSLLCVPFPSLTPIDISQWYQYVFHTTCGLSTLTLASFSSYIPIKTDYSDLTDVAAFFIGAPDGTGSHDLLAKKIAAQGKAWAEKHWREADMCVHGLGYLLLLTADGTWFVLQGRVSVSTLPGVCEIDGQRRRRVTRLFIELD
jgi:hypothetical protein